MPQKHLGPKLKWQMNMALTLQKRNDFAVEGGFTDPQNVEYGQGVSTLARYVFNYAGAWRWIYVVGVTLGVREPIPGV